MNETISKPKILVIEDDESIRTQMKWALNNDYDVLLATNSDEALKLVENERPPLVTLDLGLPPCPEDTTEGLNLLGRILERDSAVKVVVVTGSPERSAALNAVSMGAHDFFTKPIDLEELKAILKRANYVYTLEAEYKKLQEKVRDNNFGGIIGSSARMQEIFSDVSKVANTDVPVLITGESGTGKELIASAIHKKSERKDKPFVPINCGAIPENLMESELFGHEKGAFTGAHIQRKGKIEMADGGTLFLDEIGELPLSLQVKLLRFLQDHKIERVGGRETLEINVRIIAATNKDLAKLVSEGRFREDLYYRLAVINIDLPPLKERGEDITWLAKAFLKKFSSNEVKPKRLSPEAVEAVSNYEWPGNVRELENRIRRATTLAEGNTITPRDIGLESEDSYMGQRLDLKKAKEEIERKYVKMAILKHSGNISRAAEELGLSRPTLHSLIKKYDIEPVKAKT